MKKIDFASMFTLRADGRYQGYWHELINGEPIGARHAICDKDPRKLYDRSIEKETPRPITFRDAAEEWWTEHVEKELVRGSQQSYKAPFDFVVSELGDLPIGAVDAAEVNRVLLMEKKARKSKKHASTVRSIMKQILDNAIVNKHISVNPVTYVNVPPGLKQEKVEAPEEEEIEQIKANLDKPFGDFVALLLYTGLRRGEAAALTWGDIGEEFITINKAAELHGTPMIKDAKTEAGERIVPLLDPLRPFLKRPAHAKDTDYIFNDKGKMLTTAQIRTRWTNWCKAAGFAELRTYTNRRRGDKKCVRKEWVATLGEHQLRHNYATVLYEAKVDVVAAKTFMGHKDIETTRSIYTTLRKRHMNEEIEKIKESFLMRPSD